VCGTAGAALWLRQRSRGEHVVEVCSRPSVLQNAQTDLRKL
jgi:hypothetical protein